MIAIALSANTTTGLACMNSAAIAAGTKRSRMLRIFIEPGSRPRVAWSFGRTASVARPLRYLCGCRDGVARRAGFFDMAASWHTPRTCQAPDQSPGARLVRIHERSRGQMEEARAQI